MYMIFVATYSFHFNRKALLDLLSSFYDDLYYLFIQKGFPIFHGKYNMIVYLPNTMVSPADLLLFFIHHVSMVPQNPNPVASYGE